MSDNLFQSELQNALGELQQHLKDLGAAKTQIEYTKNAASNVVEGIDNLSEGYARHLDGLTTQMNEFITKITSSISVFQKESEQRIASFQSESENRIRALQEHYENKSGTLLTGLQTSQNNHNETFFKQSEEQLIGLVNSTNSSITDTLKAMETHATQINSSIANTLDVMQTHTTQVNDVYNRQNGQMQEYIVRFSQLLGMVQDLEQRINAIDFPELFNRLNTNVNTLGKQNKDIQTDVEDLRKMIRSEFSEQTRNLENQLEIQAGQLRFLRLLLILVLLVGLGSMIWNFLK